MVRIEPFQIKSGRIRSGFTAALMAVGMGIGSAAGLPAQAETFLEESGTIVPAEHSYTFEGTAGQAITITLESEEFDSVVSLIDAAGEEIAFNDDFGGTLNSALFVTLPEDGVYTVTARSFSGEGGDYQLVVRLSSPFDITYNEAQELNQQGNFEDAIARFTDAIALDDSQASAYLGRAEATLGRLYTEQGDSIAGPEDIPADIREVIISDFERAADLIAASGNEERANYLREQTDYLRNGSSEPGM
ncbi:MAG: pre-peptidase C-terminal domain-containing protein [Cyanobacteria bacterium Co-bin8]|nr:pre-peptidase C-terminal domain-containing protein [Cyanobacteria bacterium Co-bin8]